MNKNQQGLDEPKHIEPETNEACRALFDELLGVAKEQNIGLQAHEPNTIVDGTVTRIMKDLVSVDIGAKSEGQIPLNEFKETPEIGAKTPVLIMSYERDDGLMALSHSKALSEIMWNKFVTELKEGDIVEGVMTRIVKGGLMVDVDGIEAFVPRSHIWARSLRQQDLVLEELVGKLAQFSVLKIISGRKNLVLSRREVLDKAYEQVKREALTTLKEGDIVHGVVKNITDFGAFVDMVDENGQPSGIDGLLHITDLTWKRVTHPSNVVEIGQRLKVKILSIDLERQRIAVGSKQLLENPWSSIAERYKEGDIVKGRVKSVATYGAFIEVEENIEGLVHSSEVSWSKSPCGVAEILREGDEVNVKVLSVNASDEKLSLSIRACEPNPWDRVEELFEEGDKVKAKVTTLSNFGAYLELYDKEGKLSKIDAVLHISDMSWTKAIAQPNEIINKGEDIHVIIKHLDTSGEKKKITVSLKDTEENPWPGIEERHPVGKELTGKITNTTAMGHYVEIGEEVTGFVSAGSAKQTGPLKIGDPVKVNVIKVDPTAKKILLELSGQEGGDNEIQVASRD